MTIAATVVILTKNEARHIRRAVESAVDFEDILVVDSFSTDNTSEIAARSGARVVQFDWNGQYPKKKEWALAHARFDWVVYLDADEYLTPALVRELESAVERSDASAVDVPLRYFWLGRELRHGHRVQKRIAMRRANCEWPQPNDLDVKNMWEVEGHYQPRVRSGAVISTRSLLGHDDQDGLYDYFARHNRYSDWEAHMLEKRDTDSLTSRSRLGRLAATLPFKPTVFFAYSYILRMGFLDGMPGLEYARALSYYYWQINLKRRELEIQGCSISRAS
jgi:glycosyltransferase involved in cell wall biosynthesis